MDKGFLHEIRQLWRGIATGIAKHFLHAGREKQHGCNPLRVRGGAWLRIATSSRQLPYRKPGQEVGHTTGTRKHLETGWNYIIKPAQSNNAPLRSSSDRSPKTCNSVTSRSSYKVTL
jgi:hypothetical protein